MKAIAEHATLVDLEFLGKPRIIAACLLEGDTGWGIIDPGPASTLTVLEEKLKQKGISTAQIRALFLTHIHLDHAGAAGTLVRSNPDMLVYVHERGAMHLVNPSRLLQSAERLYGDKMELLWGKVDSLPAANIVALSGGETIHFGGPSLKVLYTPGHASHHVSFLDSESGTAFVGDTAGIRIANLPYVAPATPPPDINLGIWQESIQKILQQRPSRLFLTHFGEAGQPEEHFQQMTKRMEQWSEMVRHSLHRFDSDSMRIEWFVEQVCEELRQSVPADEVDHYIQGGGPELSWLGLARYWRKRDPENQDSARHQPKSPAP